MKKFAVCLLVLAGLVAANVSYEPAAAQVKKGKTRPARTKHLMKGIVFPNCAGIGKTLKAGPKDDKEWDTLAAQAGCLNEASFILMDDGRCPDGVWAKAAKTTLRNGSAELLKAIDAKDLTAARSAFKATTAACAACHKAHKK